MNFFCPWDAPKYLIFSDNIPTLFFYSHLPAMIMVLIVCLLAIYKRDKLRVNRILFWICLLFFAWSFFDLILWSTNRPDVVGFFWSLQVLFEPLIYILGFYLTYVFVSKKDLSFRGKVFLFLPYLPLILFLPSAQTIDGVNLIDCTALENFFALYYTYVVEIATTLAILIFIVKQYRGVVDTTKRKEVKFFGWGIILFLLAFSWGNITGSFSSNWALAQAGLVGMPVFVAFLTYMVVRFKTFNIKLIGAQAIVVALWFLVFSILFVRKIENARIIVLATLIFVVALGYALVRSVKKEIKAREEIAKLADDLKLTNVRLDNTNADLKSKNDALDIANARLKELDQQKTDFLSIASHQLRTPLTISKGYLELLEDGGFGKPDPEMLPIFSNMDSANERLIKMIDNFLDISRIEQGRTKYDFKVEDLSTIITEAADELKPRAAEKDITLIWTPDKKLKSLANLDHEKVRHVVYNFIDNAIKYSEKGAVTVKLEKDGKGWAVHVTDNGLGFEKTDESRFFQKFFRGDNVKGVNVTGTGIGLFVCRKFIEEHKGRVWAKSPGLGKGSEFGFWLPAK